MFSPTSNILGAASFAAFFIGGLVSLPEPDDPPVDLISLRVVGDKVFYERVVTTGQTVRSPFYGSVVEVDTENSVPECEARGSADYRPEEDIVQVFDLSDFYSSECAAALVPGVEYRPFAAVTPIAGKPDTIYGTPFIWQGN